VVRRQRSQGKITGRTWVVWKQCGRMREDGAISRREGPVGRRARRTRRGRVAVGAEARARTRLVVGAAPYLVFRLASTEYLLSVLDCVRTSGAVRDHQASGLRCPNCWGRPTDGVKSRIYVVVAWGRLVDCRTCRRSQKWGPKSGAWSVEFRPGRYAVKGVGCGLSVC
jgi:hypothetical protein